MQCCSFQGSYTVHVARSVQGRASVVLLWIYGGSLNNFSFLVGDAITNIVNGYQISTQCKGMGERKVEWSSTVWFQPVMLLEPIYSKGEVIAFFVIFLSISERQMCYSFSLWTTVVQESTEGSISSRAGQELKFLSSRKLHVSGGGEMCSDSEWKVGSVKFPTENWNRIFWIIRVLDSWWPAWSQKLRVCNTLPAGLSRNRWVGREPGRFPFEISLVCWNFIRIDVLMSISAFSAGRMLC